MLSRLKAMVERLAPADEQSIEASIEDHKLAAAALLVHAVHVDGQADPVELEQLNAILMNSYELNEAEAQKLIDMARREDERAVDLYGFTRRISKALPPEERLKIIEMLWRIAFADGVLHEFEQNMIWRVAELMHVPSRERIRLRQKVQAELKSS